MSDSADIVFLSGVRTGFGSFGGSLKDLSATDLGTHAAQAAIQRSGVEPGAIDHVVFGSDSPPVPLPLARAVDTVKQLKIAEEDKQKIFGDNAAKLLKLAA